MQLIEEWAPLLSRGLWRCVCYRSAPEGRDHPATTLAGMDQGTAHEVDTEAFLFGAQQLGYRRLGTVVGIGDH